MITFFKGQNRIIIGDLNAHHDSWYSELGCDARGTSFVDQIDGTAFCVCEDHPTRITANCRSSPDISIVSSDLIAHTTWSAHIALDSDHIPIILKFTKDADFIISEKRTFVNFRKTDWNRFEELCDAQFGQLADPTSAYVGERIFREILVKVGKSCIPAGRIAKLRPNFPLEASRLADERDAIRREDAADPRLRQMNIEIGNLVSEHCREKWRTHLQESDRGSKRLWSTLKNLTNPRRSENPTLSFEGGYTPLDSRKCASALNRQFVEHPSKPDKNRRVIQRRLRNLSLPRDEIVFSPADVSIAIKSAKNSTALGPDGLAIIMLKHLGKRGVEYLSKIFNRCLNSLEIPDMWKLGKIIPLLKPGKPSNQGSSYRPITLLSPVVKVLESLLLPTLRENLPLADHQHGFRAGHSTTTALCEVATSISDGLNSKRPHQRTVVVALDLKKAFDTVSHTKLLQDIYDSTLPNVYKRWLSNYMAGRRSYVEFRGSRSGFRKNKQGVPQGGVLSPLLFNAYLSKMPTPPPELKLISYADDCTILTTGRNIEVLEERLNGYLPVLSTFLADRNLQLSAPKSTATLFTTWAKETTRELDVRIEDTPIPSCRNPKILGVVFDSLFTFAKHAEGVAARVKGRNRVLRAVTGSTWDKDKETILDTYKAIGRPLLDYAAPVWAPALSETQWSKLQTVQNAALRVVTGCHSITPTDHLHDETKVLPVRSHCTLLTRQHLIKCEDQLHPNYNITRCRTTDRARQVRHDLRTESAAISHVAVMAQGGALKDALSAIHTEVVAESLRNLKDNVVLGGRPPPIARVEASLPRPTRVTLSQLRSGYSKYLNSYLTRVNPEIADRCPDCDSPNHTTRHLFSCPARPTGLTPESLWTNPVDAARFLGLAE